MGTPNKPDGSKDHAAEKPHAGQQGSGQASGQATGQTGQHPREQNTGHGSEQPASQPHDDQSESGAELLRLRKRVEELEGKERVATSTPLSTATARQLLDYMISDGTPKAVLKESEDWLLANPEATGEKLYRHMEAHGCDGAEGRPSAGTLRKACKFVFGPETEPDSLITSIPGEELVRLRSENETLRKNLEQANNQRAVVARQLDLANEVKNDAVRKLGLLKRGKSVQELANLGITD